MFAEVARTIQRPLEQQRRSWRIDARVVKVTLATAFDGASRSAHVSLYVWPMRRSLVLSLSLVSLWM